MRTHLKATLFGCLFSFLILPASISFAVDEAHSVPAFFHGDIGEELTLQQRLEHSAIRYFLENSHPNTGLVRDSASNFIRTPKTQTKASLGATGLALAVLANAGEREIINPAYARAYALKTLRFARDHVSRWNGWFVSHADWETGERWERSGYSTIDTALFLAGALYAAAVYPDTEIALLTYELYRQTDFFKFLTDDGTQPEKQTLSVSYTPEAGFSRTQWTKSIGASLLLMLGMGHPIRALPSSTWLAWERNAVTTPAGDSIIGADLPLSVHQYSHVFIDFRGFRDVFNVDYFDNGRKATLYNRSTCLNNKTHQSFREGFWGLSEGITPFGESASSPAYHSSTVCIGCAGGSAMYAPEMVLKDIEKWIEGPHGQRIWGRYGLIDSLDIDRNWYSTEVRGTTVGTIFLSLANTSEDTSVWRHFRKIPEIKKAMTAASHAKPE